MRASGSACIRNDHPHLRGRVGVSVAVPRHLSGPPHVVIADGLPPDAGRGLLKPLHALVHLLRQECQNIRSIKRHVNVNNKRFIYLCNNSDSWHLCFLSYQQSWELPG